MMVQTLHIDFESSPLDRVQVIALHNVALLRNDLERSLDAKRVVHIHERFTEVSSRCGLHVVGHNGTRAMSLWPKPYKGKPSRLDLLHCEYEKFFKEEIRTTIQRPTGKLH